MDAFTRSYIGAALWSTCMSGENDKPLESEYSTEDFAPETLAEMRADCQRFQNENGQQINLFRTVGDNTDSQAGYDFWLTRNRHGAGFWDGGWEKDVGLKLTNAAHAFGEYELYIGDDGQIHH